MNTPPPTDLVGFEPAQRDTPTLLAAAAAGHQGSWEQLVDRYASLVWSVARSFRLSDADAADVSQAAWLRLVQHMDQIREPGRLGAWLATTTRREALAVLRRRQRDLPVGDPEMLERAEAELPPPEAWLLRKEEDEALVAAVSALPERCRRLFRVLLADPPPSYQEVAAATGMPIGGIGPTRSRCLSHLRSILQDPTPSQPG